MREKMVCNQCKFRGKLFKLLLTSLAITLFASCAMMFPVVQNNSLSEISLLRFQLSDYTIIPTFSSELPDEFQVKFDPVVGPQSYNINKQIITMYEEYLLYKSNPNSDKVLNLSINVESFETLYQEEGGIGALVGSGDIKRSAKIVLRIKLEIPNQLLVEQTIIGNEVMGVNDCQDCHSWMDMYTAAINKAVNKAIIMTDNVIDKSIKK